MATDLTYDSLLEDLRRYAERGFNAASDPLVFEQLPRIVNLAERRCAMELKVQGFITNVVAVMAAGTEVYDKPDRWREWISFNIGTRTPLRTTQREASVGTRTLTLEKPHGWSAGQVVAVSGVSGSGYNGTFVLTAVTQLSISYVTGVVTEGATADTGGYVSTPLEKRKSLFTRSYENLRTYWPDPTEVGEPLYYADYDYYHFLVAPTPDRPYPFELNYYALPALLDSANQTNWLTDLAPQLLLYAALMDLGPFLKNSEMMQTWQGLYGQAAQAITGQDLDKIQDRTSERTKP